MKSVIVIGVIGVGILLLLLSTVWGSLFPATATWTDEKAERSAQVKSRMAYLGGVINNPAARSGGASDLAKSKEEFNALVEENEQLNNEFESAANTPQTVAKFLKWSGISLAGVGLIGWFGIKQS